MVNPCLDELEVYGIDGETNLALAQREARASASSCLSGYPIHQVRHLNDGQYGNSHSWIAAGQNGEWAQIELPAPATVAQVVFSRDREGRFRDRLPTQVEIQLSLDGQRVGHSVPGRVADLPAGFRGLEHPSALCLPVRARDLVANRFGPPPSPAFSGKPKPWWSGSRPKASM